MILCPIVNDVFKCIRKVEESTIESVFSLFTFYLIEILLD